MIRRTRSRVSSATSGFSLMIRDTVVTETPAAAAISTIVVLGTLERAGKGVPISGSWNALARAARRASRFRGQTRAKHTDRRSAGDRDPGLRHAAQSALQDDRLAHVADRPWLRRSPHPGRRIGPVMEDEQLTLRRH